MRDVSGGMVESEAESDAVDGVSVSGDAVTIAAAAAAWKVSLAFTLRFRCRRPEVRGAEPIGMSRGTLEGCAGTFVGVSVGGVRLASLASCGVSVGGGMGLAT